MVVYNDDTGGPGEGDDQDLVSTDAEQELLDRIEAEGNRVYDPENNTLDIRNHRLTNWVQNAVDSGPTRYESSGACNCESI